MDNDNGSRSGRSDLTAALCGVIDSCAWVAFLFQIPIDVFYGTTIGIKLMLVLVRGSLSFSHRLYLLFVVPAIVAAVASILKGISDLSSLLQILPFAVSLAVTLALINERSCQRYFQAFSFCVCAGIVIYLVLWLGGKIESEWGRWLFLGGAHPNLGGEFCYAAVLSAAISIRLRSFYFAALVLLSLTAAHLMQARSAMLSTFIIALVALNLVLVRRTTVALRILVLVVVVGLTAFFVQLFSSDGISGIVSSLLLLNDQHRGLGTGFVGRDEHWDSAWETFFNHPAFGVGFGYFHVQDEASPHNYWLYMISELGLLSLISLYALGQAAFSLFRQNRLVALFSCSALILTMFNDRFINMNAYPFLLYVILFFRDGSWSISAPTGAALEARATEFDLTREDAIGSGTRWS